MDAKQKALDILEQVGGVSNVKTVSHCMTRLRFVLKDDSKADQDALNAIDVVIGVVNAGGQMQVILGKNLLPVFEEVNTMVNASGTSSQDNEPKKKEKFTWKGFGNTVLGYISASVTPLLPGLIAGGMLKVLLLILNLTIDGFAATQTYALLSAVADASFFFMPIFIAYGAATKLGGTSIYAMAGAAALLHANYTSLVAAGEPISLLGLPVYAGSYASSLVPALLIALAAYEFEKLWNKVVPGIFKSIFVGMLTMLCTMVLGYTILAPLGAYIGNYLSYIFVFLSNTVGPIAVCVLAACLPWLVMCGMHTALVPFMAAAITDPGYDGVFRPAFILHNMSEGGSCFGVALRTKDKNLRAEAFSIGFGCIFAGVTEPAIYGINLPRKKPMLGVMAGGLVGGIVAGLMGARAFEMGYSTVLALPIFESTALAMTCGIVVSIITAMIVTYVLGFEEKAPVKEESAPVTAPEENVPASASTSAIVAGAKGKTVDLSTVNDPMFSQKLMGDGFAVDLPNEVQTICAPVDGTMLMVANSGHAFGIGTEDGIEVLVHIGIDTVNEAGKGFKVLVQDHQKVLAGDPVIEVDVPALKAKGYDLSTMVIVTNPNGYTITYETGNEVTPVSVVGKVA